MSDPSTRTSKVVAVIKLPAASFQPPAGSLTSPYPDPRGSRTAHRGLVSAVAKALGV